MFTIDYNDLLQMKKLKKNIFIKNDQILIKVLTKSLQNDLQRISEIENHAHIIKPLQIGVISYQDSFKEIYHSCYEMTYLKDAATFYELIGQKIPYDKKMQYCKYNIKWL